VIEFALINLLIIERIRYVYGGGIKTEINFWTIRINDTAIILPVDSVNLRIVALNNYINLLS
jgi:hypothetical protein